MTIDRVPVGTTHWYCATCDKWNSIKDILCKKCKGNFVDCGRAFKIDDPSSLEKNFYEVTAPAILAELRSIRIVLERR